MHDGIFVRWSELLLDFLADFVLNCVRNEGNKLHFVVVVKLILISTLSLKDVKQRFGRNKPQ